MLVSLYRRLCGYPTIAPRLHIPVVNPDPRCYVQSKSLPSIHNSCHPTLCNIQANFVSHNGTFPLGGVMELAKDPHISVQTTLKKYISEL